MSQKVAVVTGANKGIGLAIVKGLAKKCDGVVYLTSRDKARGEAAVKELNTLGLKPVYHQLDVSDKDSVVAFRDYIKKVHGGIDILINNAGVNCEEFYSDYETCKYIIDINYNSFLILKDLIFPLVRDGGRIVNISSDCGHLSNIRNEYWIKRLSDKNLTLKDIKEFVDWYLDSVKKGTFNKDDIADDAVYAAYRVAKVALSAFTIVVQKELESRNIAMNSMHPGLVRTEMTMNSGFYNVDQAAETPIYLALEAPQTLKGQYIWYDGKVLDWYNYKADYFFKSKSLNTYATLKTNDK